VNQRPANQEELRPGGSGKLFGYGFHGLPHRGEKKTQAIQPGSPIHRQNNVIGNEITGLFLCADKMLAIRSDQL